MIIFYKIENNIFIKKKKMGCNCKQAKTLAEIYRDRDEITGIVKTGVAGRITNWLIACLNRIIVIILIIICIPVIAIDLIISFCIYGKLTISTPKLLYKIMRAKGPNGKK